MVVSRHHSRDRIAHSSQTEIIRLPILKCAHDPNLTINTMPWRFDDFSANRARWSTGSSNQPQHALAFEIEFSFQKE
jgi:hypothetical protein